jgi:hypothetical protein
MFIDDNNDFPNFTQEEYNNTLFNNRIGVDIRNHLTYEKKSFDSIAKASLYLNKSGLNYYLNRNEQPLFCDGWQVKQSQDKWVEFDDIEKELYIRNINVMAKHEETNKIVIARSALHMSVELGLDSKAIRNAALTRGNKIYHGYRFRLGFSNEPWPIN